MPAITGVFLTFERLVCYGKTKSVDKRVDSRRLKMKKCTVLFLAISLLVFCISPISVWAQEKPITIKFAWQMPMLNYESKGCEMLAKAIETASKGRVKVETYPAASLYKGHELYPAVRSGSVEMVMDDMGGALSTLDPAAEVVYLPFLFQNNEHMLRSLHGNIGKRAEAGVEKAGAKVLAYYAASGGVYGTKSKPIRKPEDFAGQKIRVPSGIMAETVKALGGAPVTIVPSEVYLALQRGTADGANFLVSSFYDRKLFEILKYLTLAYVHFNPEIILVNLKFWKSLPPDLQEIISKCALDTEKWVYEESIKTTDHYKQVLKEKGMELIEIPKEDRMKWINATKVVFDKFISRVGPEAKDLIDYALKEAR